MPCESSYLEASQVEKDRRRAAQLLLYVWKRQSAAIPDWLVHTAASSYGEPRGDRAIQELCATLRAMPDADRETFVYGNARDVEARHLADWWEHHQAADFQRAVEEGVRFQDVMQAAPLARPEPAPPWETD